MLESGNSFQEKKKKSYKVQLMSQNYLLKLRLQPNSTCRVKPQAQKQPVFHPLPFLLSGVELLNQTQMYFVVLQ